MPDIRYIEENDTQSSVMNTLNAKRESRENHNQESKEYTEWIYIGYKYNFYKVSYLQHAIYWKEWHTITCHKHFEYQ